MSYPERAETAQPAAGGGSAEHARIPSEAECATTRPADGNDPYWLRALSVALPVVALGAILQFLILAGFRMLYPFELEWMEGGSIDQMWWVLDGHSLYGEPTVSFVPIFYNPFYFVLSAALMKVIGVSADCSSLFTAPRLVSILSTVGCFLLLFLIVAKDARHPIPGLVAAGVYAAAFRFAGAWMDIARPDSLFLCLLLAAFFVGRRYPGRRGLVISGLLYVLAYYTKQNVLAIVLVAAPISFVASRGRTWPQWLTVAVLGPAVFFGLDAASGGWYSFYSFDLMTYRTMVPDVWFFWRAIIGHMWPAVLLALFYAISTLARPDSSEASISEISDPPELNNARRRGLVSGLLSAIARTEGLWYDLGLVCALLLSSWSTFLQRWAYENNFMPACAGLAMLAGLGYGRALQLTQRSARRGRDWLLRGGTALLLLCQFAALLYNPLDQLPDAEARDIWERFIDRLSERPGEVLVFNHGFVNHLAGKNTYLHVTSYSDAIGGGAGPPRTEDNRWRREKVRAALEGAVVRQVFDWVVTGVSADAWLPYYILNDEEPVVFQPVTGAPAGPEGFLIKNPVARGGSFPLTDASYGFLLSEGWGAPEDWGRWAVGRRSAIQVALELGHDYELAVEAFPFCPSGVTEQAVEVGWNDLSLGTHTFASCESDRMVFGLSSEMVGTGLSTLWFEFAETASPVDAGLSGDQRPLSVGFTALTFAQKEQ